MTAMFVLVHNFQEFCSALAILAVLTGLLAGLFALTMKALEYFKV